MFEKLKNRITNLETETEQLKSELAKVRTELADVKRLFSKLTGEIAALRRQTDSILRLGGIVPAFPVVRKTDWPTEFAAEDKTS
jgi:hypothetical protein